MFIQQNLMFCGIVPFPINCGQDAVCSTGYSEARLPPSSALALPGPLHRPTAQSQAPSWKIKEPGSLDNLQPLKPSGFRPRSEEVSQSLSKLARSPSQSKDLENLKSPRGFCTSGIAQSLEAALAPVSTLPVQEGLGEEAGEGGLPTLRAGELRRGQV